MVRDSSFNTDGLLVGLEEEFNVFHVMPLIEVEIIYADLKALDLNSKDVLNVSVNRASADTSNVVGDVMVDSNLIGEKLFLMTQLFGSFQHSSACLCFQ